MNIPLFIQQYYTLLLVMCGTGLLGATAGALGVFAVLRKQSLLSDALSHAALPGIALSFLLTGSNHTTILLIGGAITSLIATGLTELIITCTPLKRDTVLGIILSVFFGIGLIVITIIQKQCTGQQQILNTFIFGNAATLLINDLYTLIILAVLTYVTITLWWYQFALLCFDRSYARTRTPQILYAEITLTLLLIMCIMVGLQIVGVVLMSALIIAPVAAAQQWTQSLLPLVLASAVIGSFCSIIGSLISHTAPYLPTGPIIVVILSCVTLASFMCTSYRRVS